jgi:hypothetical protein
MGLPQCVDGNAGSSKFLDKLHGTNVSFHHYNSVSVILTNKSTQLLWILSIHYCVYKNSEVRRD